MIDVSINFIMYFFIIIIIQNYILNPTTIIFSLKSQLGGSMTWRSGSFPPQQPALNDKERRAIEDRLIKIRQDMEAKRLSIKNLKMSLERLDITE
jgi:sulfur dioxygenase